MSDPEDELTRAKEVAFYEALINASITTKLERDKSLLSLATGAVGVLITLMTTVGAPNVVAGIAYAVAIASFIATIFFALDIFKHNARHVEDVLKGKDGDDEELTRLDEAINSAFMIGIIAAVIVGLSFVYHNHFENNGNQLAPEVRNPSVAIPRGEELQRDR